MGKIEQNDTILSRRARGRATRPSVSAPPDKQGVAPTPGNIISSFKLVVISMNNRAHLDESLESFEDF